MEELSPSKKSKYDEEIANGGAIRGVVVLMKKNVVGVNDVAASVVDRFDELLGRKVALHLVGCPNVLDRDSASSGMFLDSWLWMEFFFLIVIIIIDD